jgi:predicted amidohydrolase
MANTRVAVAHVRPTWCPTAHLLAEADGLAARALSCGVELVALPGALAWRTVGYTGAVPDDAASGWATLAAHCSAEVDAHQRWMELGERLVSGLLTIAASHGVWLVAGGIPLALDSGVGNAAVVVSPQGELASVQWQTHLNEHQIRLGLVAGDSLSPMDVGWASLGLVVGDDVLFPEVGRVLCLQGATLLVHPGASHSGQSHAMMARLWRDVQANQVFGLESGWAESGQYGAAILGPCELSSDGAGVLASAGDGQADLAVADLLWDRRRQVLDAYPIYDSLHRALYERYLPHLYRQVGT